MAKSVLTAIFVGTVILVIAMGLMLVVPTSGHTRNTSATFALTLALAISGGQLTMSAIGRRPAAASMMAHLFLVFFLIVPALFQVTTATYAWDMSFYSEDTVTTAAALVLLFVVSFVLGGSLGPKDLKRAMRTVAICERRRRGAIVIGFVLFAVVIAVLAVLGFGIDTLIENRSTLTSFLEENETKTSAAVLLELPRALSFCGVLAALYLFGRKTGRRGGQRQTVAILLTLLIVPLFGILNYPLAQARYWLLGMAIAVAFMYVDMRRVGVRLLFIAGIGGGVYTLFPLIRTLTTTDTLNTEIELKPAGIALFTGDFDGFEMVMNIVIVAEKFGYTWGHQLLSAALFFIPRSLWAGKALATGAYTATKLGQAFTNLSAPIMGELYLDFSYFGVIVGGLLIGYLYKKADTLFAAALAFGGVSLYRILTALVCGFTIILMRGALLAVIASIATSLAAIAVLIATPRVTGFFVGRGRRAAA